MVSDVVFNFVVDKLRRFHLSPLNRLCHVGTYVRELPVNLDRMYENALDGEHLPHLHSSTFSYINILDSGSWGWRAKAGLQPKSRMTDMEIKLELFRDEYCWKTTTLAGLGKGTEIWTHVIPLEENSIKVVVDFYVPKVPSFLKSVYTDYYVSTYERLYDEDVMMMSQRQQALNHKKESYSQPTLGQISLGKRDSVLAKLPIVFKLNKHRYCLNQINGELIAYSANCPHMLAPLEDVNVIGGVIECPWHAYKFDVKTGDCVSGQACRLKRSPIITVDPKSDEVIAKLEQSETI